MLIEISNREAEAVMDILNNHNVEFNTYKSCYYVLAKEEAQASLDYAIENEDVYITKEQYEECLEETIKSLMESDEDIMQDLSHLAHDLAMESLKKFKVLVE